MIRTIFSFVFILSFLFVTGQTATAPLGSGTSADPYQISNLNNLYWISQNTASWVNGKYFIQTADIDASSTSTWFSDGSGGYYGFPPIGGRSSYTTTNQIAGNFSATYDGQNYSIVNLYMNRTYDEVGLFGYVSSATIKNISLKNMTFICHVGAVWSTNYYGVGMLVGGGSTLNLNNCHIVGGTMTNNSDIAYIGVVLGRINALTATNCSSSANFSTSIPYATSTNASFGSGGFIGYFSGLTNISYCYCTGNISTNGAGRVGGFAGFTDASSSGSIISQCYSTGNVNIGSGSYAGGFIGMLYNYLTISNCFALGNVTGTSIGGFYGYNWGATPTPSIQNCYCKGTISGTNKGAFGYNAGPSTLNCFFDNQTSGLSNGLYTGTNNNIVGESTTNMKTQSTFTSAGWDFSTTPIWYMNVNNNSGYPSLVMGSALWNGSNNTDWNVSSNWLPSVVPTSLVNVLIPSTSNQPIITSSESALANTVTIQNGATLTLTGSGTLTASNGITVAPGGALVGNSSNVTGTVTLQQNVVGQRGWRVFGNPFSTNIDIATVASTNGITIGTTVPNSGITDSRTYSYSTGLWSNVTTSSWTNGLLYALFIRGLASEVTGNNYTGGPSAFVYTVSGSLNSASVSRNQSAGVFRVIGNPFAAPVNTSALTGQTVGVPYYTYQITAQAGSTNGTLNTRIKSGSWVASGSNSSTSSTIPVLGALCYMPTNGNPFTITTADINTTGTLQTSLFGLEPQPSQLELVMESEGNYQDKLFLNQNTSATANGTDRIDLQKFDNDVTNMYTITPDGLHMAIDARNVFDRAIPLGLSTEAGDYNFRVNSNTLPSGTTVYLKDNLLQTQTALQTGTTYNFSVTTDTASQGEHRFALVFATKNIATAIDSSNAKFTAKVMGNVVHGNTVLIEIAGSESPISIVVRDMNGKILSSAAGVNGSNTVQLGSITNGMHIVQISNGSSIITEKIIKL